METLYKVLRSDGGCYHGGTGSWPLPKDEQPGEWMPEIEGELIACERGYHVCRRADLPCWIGPAIWTVEIESEPIIAADKLVVRRARLLRRTAWDVRAALLWAADCAEHVLPIFEVAMPGDDRPRRAIEAARGTDPAAAAAAAEVPREAAAWAAAARKAAAWEAAAAAERERERVWQTDRLRHYLGEG